MTPFHSLDDTLLQQVLLRCRSSDFPALHRTCRRFRSTVESESFRKLRVDQEWVEVKTIIKKRKYRRGDNNIGQGACYSEDASVAHNSATLVVDNCKAGSVSFVFVRRLVHDFYESCDQTSSDLEHVAARFFDGYGRALPKVPSVWNSLTENEGIGGVAKSLLYISRMSWNKEYRSCSLVGAKALRCLLVDSFLKDDWSICMYIPESQEARDTSMQAFMRPFSSSSRTKDEYKDQEALSARRSELVVQDTRQFLRAGFVQAQETIKTSQCIHLFAVPSFLQVCDVLSDEDTQSIPVHEPNRRRHVDEDFLSFVMEQCYMCGEKKSELQNSYTAMQKLREGSRECSGALQENLARLRESFESARQRFQVKSLSPPVAGGSVAMLQFQADQEQTTRELSDLEVMFQNVESQLSAVPETESSLLERTAVSRQGLGSFLEKFAERVSKFKELGADLGSSNVIHACAANLETALIDSLLSPLSNEEVHNVINSLDTDGMTPLMRAALTGVGSMAARVETITRLFHYGADKNIVDEKGLTALGKFGVVSSSNYRGHPLADHEPRDPALVSRIQALLTPVGGPTPADNLVLYPTHDDDDDDMFDDDDEDLMDEDEDSDDSSGEPEVDELAA